MSTPAEQISYQPISPLSIMTVQEALRRETLPMCDQKDEAKTKLDRLIAAMDRLTNALEGNRVRVTGRWPMVDDDDDDNNKKTKPFETSQEKLKESPPPPNDERGTSIKDGFAMRESSI